MLLCAALLSAFALGCVSATARGPLADSLKCEQPASARSTALQISEVVDLWAIGKESEAISALLAMRTSPEARWRLSDVSEKQFVALPQAERDVVQQRLLKSLELLRAVVREVDRRARVDIRTGNSPNARRYVETIRRLASANRGRDVTLVVDMVGKSFEKRADELQAAIDKSARGPG